MKMNLRLVTSTIFILVFPILVNTVSAQPKKIITEFFEFENKTITKGYYSETNYSNDQGLQTIKESNIQHLVKYVGNGDKFVSFNAGLTWNKEDIVKQPLIDLTSYPNPVDELLNLSFSMNESNIVKVIKILDIFGIEKDVPFKIESNIIVFDMELLSKGTYLIHIIDHIGKEYKSIFTKN
jgi:hypothetical protein